jgi:hypothetical protein
MAKRIRYSKNGLIPNRVKLSFCLSQGKTNGKPVTHCLHWSFSHLWMREWSLNGKMLSLDSE